MSTSRKSAPPGGSRRGQRRLLPSPTTSTTTMVDPLLSIVIGVAVYDEHLMRATGTNLLLIVLLAVLAVAVVQLSRDPNGPAATS